MPQIVWSRGALLNVKRLHYFIFEKNPEAAKRAAKAIRESLRILEKQPQVGKPIEDMDAEYREWAIKFGDSGYVALYRFQGETAVILAVRHQKEAGY